MDVNGKNEIHYLWISCLFLLFFPTCPPLKVWHPSCLPCAAAAAARSLQSCPTLCNSIDGSPPGSSIPGILRARTLEWVAISFSNAWKWKVKVKLFSCVRLLAPPWTAAFQAPPSMGFSRQEYWSGENTKGIGKHSAHSHLEFCNSFASHAPWSFPAQLNVMKLTRHQTLWRTATLQSHTTLLVNKETQLRVKVLG